MITKEQLNSINYISSNQTTYSMSGNWEYEYNIKTQELWNINDGVGEPELLCRVTDFEELKNLLDILPNPGFENE